MQLQVSLLWKILTSINSSEIDSTSLPSKLFNRKGGRSFVSSLGGDFQINTSPVVLAPTDIFHASLRQTRKNLGFDGNRFPYSFTLPATKQLCRANIALHLHDQVLCTTVQLDDFEIGGEIDWSSLRNIKKHGDLWNLIYQVILTTQSDLQAQSTPLQNPQILPAIYIEAMESDIFNWQEQLVSLVTGHAEVNEAVIKSVFDKNKTHRIDKTALLIDKQGVAAYSPAGSTKAVTKANRKRFQNAAAMLQLASVLRKQLRDGHSIPEGSATAITDPENSVLASISSSRMWSLFVSEFSLINYLNATGNTPEIKLNTVPTNTDTTISAQSHSSKFERILLITVTSPETTALNLELINLTGQRPATENHNGFTYKNFGKHGGFEIFHQISGMGSGGINGSQVTIQRSIEAIHPDSVLMIGIAFGVNQQEQPIGTILVSNQLQNYELQRRNRDATIELRGDKVTAPSKTLNWVSHAITTWPKDSHKVDRGLLLSGEKLIDNSDFKGNLVQIIPSAIGGEMEGTGLYTACQTSKVDWLIIKSVCDWADGNKFVDKDARQEEAAKSAAKFAVHVLRENQSSA